MRVTKKPSGRVIFFFCCKSCNFFSFAVNACNKKTVRWCNFFFFAVRSCKPAYTTYSEKKKLHDYTVFLLRAFTAKKKNYTNYNIHCGMSEGVAGRGMGQRGRGGRDVIMEPEETVLGVEGSAERWVGRIGARPPHNITSGWRC